MVVRQGAGRKPVGEGARAWTSEVRFMILVDEGSEEWRRRGRRSLVRRKWPCGRIGGNVSGGF